MSPRLKIKARLETPIAICKIPFQFHREIREDFGCDVRMRSGQIKYEGSPA